MSDDENSNNTDAGPPTQPKPRALSRLTVEEMRQELSTLGLRSDGLRPTLLKRLKTHQNQQAARPTSPSSGTTTAAPTLPPHRLVSGPAPLPYQVPIPGTPEYDAAIASGGPIQLDRAASSAGPLLCVIDVEATCQEGHTFAFPNEIIELPAVLMDMDGNFLAEFHTYVRPTLYPVLSEYCTRLTGVTQDLVDSAPLWPDAQLALEEWLRTQVTRWVALDQPGGIYGTHDGDDEEDENEDPTSPAGIAKRVLVVSDGPWDLRDFVRKSNTLHRQPTPLVLRRFTDLRKYLLRTVEHSESSHRRALLLQKARSSALRAMPSIQPQPHRLPANGNAAYEGGNLELSLAYVGLRFVGRPHCGRDDTRNIARVVQALVARGYRMGPNWRRISKHGGTGAVDYAALWEAERDSAAAAAKKAAAKENGEKDEEEGDGSPSLQLPAPEQRGGYALAGRKWVADGETWQWWDVGTDGHMSIRRG